MAHRALAVSLLILLVSSCAAAQRGTATTSQNGVLTGSVHTFDDSAVGDARVELRQMNTGSVVASTYSSMDGSFEFRNLADGSYEVVVTSGLSQTAEMAQVHDGTSSVTLRLPAVARGQADAGDHNTVSVQQMKVPGKARDELKKAQKAAQKADTAEANKHVQRALELYPKFAEALTLRALLHLDAEHSHDAVADLESAIEADNNYALAYLVLGTAYNIESRFDDAIRVLDRGVSLSPNSWQGYFELAKAYVAKQDLPAATRQINKAGELAPKEYGPVHLIRANIYLKLKNYPEAMSELEAYLERDPNSPNAVTARQTLEQVKAFVATK